MKTTAAQSANTKTTLRASPRQLAALAEIFKLLADENRLKILFSLARRGEQNVSALCDMLRQSQPAVSHHLTLLRMKGLVGYRRAGKHNFYRMDSDYVRGLLTHCFGNGHNGKAKRKSAR